MTKLFNKPFMCLIFITLVLCFLPNAVKAAYESDSLKPLGSGASGSTSVVFDTPTQEYRFVFTATDGSESVKYTLPLSSTNLQKGLISVKAQLTTGLNVRSEIYPVNWGGAIYRDNTGALLAPYTFSNSASVSYTHALASNVVTFTYTETYQSIVTTKSISYQLQGKTLVIQMTSSGTGYNSNYAGFTFDHTLNTPNVVPLRMTYAEDGPFMKVNNDYFISTVVDRFKSNSTAALTWAETNFDVNSAYAAASTSYEKNSANQINPLSETVYVTVSSNAMDTIYATNKTKSIYRDSLSNKVIWDYWSTVSSYGNDYKENKGKIITSTLNSANHLKNDWKMDNILVIDHQWQRHDYDLGLPEHYPANPMNGTNTEYRNLITSYKNNGWMVALHEDYWFNYEDASINKYWDTQGKADLAKNANGSYRLGWVNPSFAASYAFRSEKMKYYSDLESTQIKNDYAPNATYLDVSTAWGSESLNQITLNASETDSRTIKSGVSGSKSLFDSIRTIYSGPLLGEGAGDPASAASAFAGYADAVEREIVGDANAKVMVDYELKVIRPLMANEGMGYPSRYFTTGSPTSTELDRYRAMSIVFAHSGFIHRDYGALNPAGKEYYMMQALQSEYLNTAVSVSTIEYWNGSAYRTLDQALKEDYDFTKSRIHISYSNGLNIYANFDTANWSITVGGTAYTLDSNGWVASNTSSSLLAYSALKSGSRVDYIDTPSYTFVDGRGVSTNFGTITSKGMVLKRKDLADTTAPTISNVYVDQISGTSAVLHWTTNEPTGAEADYGTTASYGLNQVAALDFNTTQKLLLTNLTAATPYHFQVKSQDISGNSAQSTDFVFTTLPAGTFYNSAFSSTQGSGQWSYQYWNGTVYSNLSWDAVNLRWYLGTDANLIINQSGMHPGSSNDAVLKWVAPTAGYVQIEGTATASDPNAQFNYSDGVLVDILHNTQNIWNDSLNNDSGKLNGSFLLNRYVKANDVIYFKVNRKTNVTTDFITINPKITYVSKTSFNGSTDYNAVQGKGSWYYQTWNGTAYANMAYDTPNSKWSLSSAAIASDWMLPSATVDAARVWIATTDSEIKISGNIRKKVTGGDGVIASVLINGSAIWSQMIGASDTVGLNPVLRAHVAPGDLVVFRLNRNSTATSDDIYWNPTVEYISPYDSAVDYSGVQGQNQWSYQSWDGTAYANLTWNSGSSLWEETGTNLAVASVNMHPELTKDAVRKWVAPNNGIVNVNGSIQNPDIGGDGVTIVILKNAIPYWSKNVGGSDAAAYAFNFKVTVQQGDILYFRVNKNTTISFDSINVIAQVSYDSMKYTASTGFSGLQGKEQWGYKKLNGSTYTDLTWDAVNLYWTFGTNGRVASNYQHPETSDKSVRRWTAPFAGKIRVTGSTRMAASGGDGVNATIKKNTVNLWSRFIYGDKFGYEHETAYYHDLVIMVNAGDTIDFVTDLNTTLSFDGLYWDPTISYIP